jgi:hypothetical protein
MNYSYLIDDIQKPPREKHKTKVPTSWLQKVSIKNRILREQVTPYKSENNMEAIKQLQYTMQISYMAARISNKNQAAQNKPPIKPQKHSKFDAG